jgi:hypothetical protein
MGGKRAQQGAPSFSTTRGRLRDTPLRLLKGCSGEEPKRDWLRLVVGDLTSTAADF